MSNSREPSGLSGLPDPSGISVTMSRVDPEEMINSYAEHTLSGRKDPSPESGANVSEQL